MLSPSPPHMAIFVMHAFNVFNTGYILNPFLFAFTLSVVFFSSLQSFCCVCWVSVPCSSLLVLPAHCLLFTSSPYHLLAGSPYLHPVNVVGGLLQSHTFHRGLLIGHVTRHSTHSLLFPQQSGVLLSLNVAYGAPVLVLFTSFIIQLTHCHIKKFGKYVCIQ